MADGQTRAQQIGLGLQGFGKTGWDRPRQARQKIHMIRLRHHRAVLVGLESAVELEDHRNPLADLQNELVGRLLPQLFAIGPDQDGRSSGRSPCPSGRSPRP